MRTLAPATGAGARNAQAASSRPAGPSGSGERMIRTSCNAGQDGPWRSASHGETLGIAWVLRASGGATMGRRRSSVRIEFDGWLYDGESRQLLRAGQPVHL